MTNKTLLSIIESPSHPNFTDLYQQLGFQETQLTSIRKANNWLKKQQPDFIIAEFFYAFGNNYSGVHISNLDVLLVSLQKYSPNTKIIILVDKTQAKHVDHLKSIFPLHAVLQFPIAIEQIKSLLSR
ncbi:MAG: hypothetical protein HON94_06970 [Methylococcales bacterium]|jgi:hypothetical protein|nr:hypothetical protein [Methylococcales bacterium]MBT7411202.1 hypothetical protein [Methylococcales bacterium]